MRWKSFLRFFTRAWRQARIPIRNRPDGRSRQLSFDVLEVREMLSAAPTILEAIPLNGSTLTGANAGNPTLQIEFSDEMVGTPAVGATPATGALNPSNYVLLGSSGTLVPITGVSFASPADNEVDLTYSSGNAGNALEVATYTLYVRGNNLVSATTGLAMAQPGQLFAANSGTNEVSVVNIPGTSGVGAASNYSVPFTSPTSALPNAVALADINGDGIPDLIVADEGTDEVNVYAGLPAADGGGYNTTPTLTLALPAATPTASTAESIAVGDFNGATFPDGAQELDFAVASGNSDSVTVFMNSSTSVGVTSFASGVVYDATTGTTIDADPVGITAGDFDGSGNISLAVAASTATGGKYVVDILPGSAAGAFGAVQQVDVGSTTAPVGLTDPSSIASIVLPGSAKPTLVVGGNDGLEVLKNNSSAGNFSFAAQPLLTSIAIDSVAVGPLSAGGADSIAALTTVNSVLVFDSNGSGGFAAAYTQTVPTTTGGQIAIGNLNNSGDGDIVVTNGTASSSVTVVKNLSIGGTVTSAAVDTAHNPVVVYAPGNDLTTGQSVTITGNTLAAANVTANPITILGDSIASVTASAGNVTVTTNTSGALYGLVVGDTVTIANTGLADGTFTLTAVNVVAGTFTFTDGTVSGNASGVGTWTDPNKFILNGTTGAVAGGAGGTWAEVGGISAASEVGGTGPIVITSPNNGLVTGDSVSIQGIPGFAAAGNTLSGAITNTEPPNNDPDTITTTTTGLVNGMTVTISGVQGDTNANGTWTISNVGPTSFQIAEPPPGSGPAAYAGGGVWTVGGSNTITVLGSAVTQASVSASGVVTITAASTYGLSAATSDRVIISGSSLAVANGTWTITSVVANTFSFSNPAATTVGASGTGGSWTSPDKFTLDGNDSAGASTGPGGTWTTLTSFTTGNAVNFSTGATVTGTVTNASAVVTGMISTAGLSVGMAVSGTGIPAGATIASVVSSSSILLSVNATAGGTPALTFTTSYGTGADPVGVAVGDTNSDGNLDVVTANFGANANDVTLLLGNGNGTLQVSANLPVPSSSLLQSVVVADLNDSGIDDIIVANDVNGDNNTKITIYQGLGNGEYAPGVTINPGNVQTIVGLAVGHFSNATGSSADFPDIVYADSTDDTIGFLQNNLTAGEAITAADITTAFTATPTVSTGASGGLSALAVGDLNGDGLTDVLVSGQFPAGGGHHFGTTPGVAVLLNTSTNANNFQFAPPADYDTSAAANISSIAVGDFNNNGLLDFVAAVNNAPGQVIVNTNNGDGTFTAGTSYFTSVNNPVSVAVGDFTVNGYEDIVVASSSTAATNSGVAVLLNQFGTGFGSAIVTAVDPGTALESVVVDDVNGDGIPDLVVATDPISGNITGASGATTPITIDTTSGGLANGDTVTISGVLGDTAANGTWTISNYTTGGHGGPNTFTIPATGNAAYTSGGTWVIGDTQDNVFVLLGNSAGTFASPTPYLLGPAGALPGPTHLAVTPTPLQPVTTFTTGGDLIETNLVNNGSFASQDLASQDEGESQGNLLGWQTYNDPLGGGSAGVWTAQTGTASPLSGTTVPAPSGSYQAMLDEPNIIPVDNGFNNNLPSSYFGSNALYQDVTIPADATSAELSMSLYIDDTGLGVSPFGSATPGTWTDPVDADPGGNSSLSFSTALANQQVRVDIMGVQLITGASDPSTGPIVISFNEQNGDAPVNGEQVTISGVAGNTAANGTWFVEDLTGNTFALYEDATEVNNVYTFTGPVMGNGAYTGGGSWTQNILSVNNTGTGADPVLEQLFQTYSAGEPTVPSAPFTTSALTYSGEITANLEQFAGQTIRIRIASAANQGPLIVGADNVSLNVQFADAVKPTLTNLAVNNPSFTSGGIAYTNDPTITGTIGDAYGLDSIAYVAFDPTNGNFTSTSVSKTAQWDAAGNFSFTLPDAVPGLNTIGVEVVDRAGNATNTTFSFFLQTNSVTQWDPVGPEGISVANQGVNYSNVSGRITATLADQLDPSGNTYLVGTPNGGIWRTTDGGNNWTAVTDTITSSTTGQPVVIPVSIGAMAQAPSDPNVMYAGTGVGDDQIDSLPGVGILKSTNDGLSWELLEGSVADFTGARITAMVVDPNDPTGNTVFAAVAAGGPDGPGVYRSMDGGNTWTLITNPTSNMYTTVAPYLPGNGALIGGSIGSVTSMVINPYNTFGELVIGIGDVGLGVAASATGGVWMTTNAFTPNAAAVSWAQIVGDNTAGVPNDTLPTGNTLGRVTVTIGTATSTDDKYIYVLIGSIGPGASPGSVNYGRGVAGNDIIAGNQTISGLYKSSDNGLDWTQVGLMQDIGNYQGVGLQNHDFVDINLLGEDGDNAGSLLIDPTDPNAVYVGGSNFYGGGSNLDHALIYVDTGDMLDYDTPDEDGIIRNNGDDIQKYDQAINDSFDYDPVNLGDPYQGEGVYWYDIIQGQSGANGNLDLLPGEITSLTLDAQGRILIGTVGGIWRGVDNGFGYDFTSGNTGILQGGGHHMTPPFTTPGLSFTSINGNLQISDMTSVAIDPQDADSFYTTQVDTGVASYTPADGWVSQGLTGPTTAAGVDLGIPTAVVVLTAETADGGVDLYRIWEYAAAGALLPEVSTDGGATWEEIGAVPSGVMAGESPALAINPTVLTSNGVPFNQLLFGGTPTVVTVDSANTWNNSGSPAGVAAGAEPTAAAIAPSNDQVYYIGDSDGEVWATGSGGGGSGSWTLATGAAAGLPTVSANSPIEGVTVNPDNAANVFVMYGGTTSSGDHVYESSNGTAASPTYTPITGPWGAAAAYAMVIDPTVALGAPNGKIYLATQVGVYLSIDGGASWTVLGQGMPNVPVVDLAYNPTLQTLAAATLGRGVFTINTAAISVIPSQTVNENTPGVPSTSAAIPFTVNDDGGAAYTITATSSNPSLIANGTIGIGGSGDNRTIQFTPTLDAYNTPINNIGGAGIGDWQGPNSGATAETITLTLTSGTFSFHQTFNVAVDFVDIPPTVTTPASQTIQTGVTSAPIAVTVGDVEEPAGAVVLQASSNNQALISNANLIVGGAESITAASYNAGVATITVSGANTFKAGQQVTIAGLTPSGYDGTFTIAASPAPSASSFSFALATNPGEPGGTAAITGASWAGGVVTVTAANTFSAGEQVVISGITPAGYDNSGNPVTITTASATGFQYDLVTNPGAATGFTGAAAALTTGTVLGTATTANRTLTITPTSVAITGASYNAGTGSAQIVLTSASGFSAGQTVVISGVSPTPYDGVFTISAVDSATNTISYALSTNPGAGSVTAASTAALAGSAVITLSATDATGGLTQTTFNVLVTATATVPFSDNFNNPANSPFVGPGWNTNLGTPAVVNGAIQATTTTTANIATLNGLSQSAIALQADVSVGGAAGQYAGLVARYSGAGDTNMYLGEIYSTGSGYEAIIEKNVKGKWTALSAVVIPAALTAVPVTSASWTAAVGVTPATVTVAAANDFSVGQMVVIAGMSRTGYDGTFKILSATSTTFTYALTKNPGGAATSGTASVTGIGTLFFDVTGTSLKLYYGPTGTSTPTLLTYAFDSSLSTGTAGFRMSGSSTGATTLDNFSAAAIPAPPTQSLPFSDTFTTPATLYTTQAASNQLDASWIESMGNFKDTGAGVAVSNTTAYSVATVSGVNAGDVSVTADVSMSAVGQFAGLVARASAATNSFYVGFIEQTSATTAVAFIYRYTNGSPALLAESKAIAGIDINAANALEFDVQGDSLKLFVNGSLATYAEVVGATALTSGSVGMYTHGMGVTIDGDFTASTIASGAATLPFSDTFTSGTGPSADQLNNANWVQQAGNFNISTGNAVSQGAGLNVASVILAAPATDVSVTGSVSLSKIGEFAGLIARASAYTNSYYVGFIEQTSATTAVAFIYRYSNGSPVLLAESKSIAGIDTGSTNALIFDVQGESLKLFVNGSLATFAEVAGATALASGSIGIYAYGAGVTIDSGFAASAITSGTAALTFTDTFNAAPNYPSLGNQLATANWVEQAGNFNVSSGNAVSQGAGLNVASVLLATPATDVSVTGSVSLSKIGEFAGLIARASAFTNSYYVGFIEQTSATAATAFIYRYTNGSSSLLAESKSITTGVNLGANDALEFDVQGDSLKLFVNGNLATFAEVAGATALTSGSVGMYAYGAGVTIDAGFTATAITSGTATLPFTDTFASGTGPSADQLNNANWIEQYGNFNVSTGNAVSKGAGLNVASVLLATPATDVSVTATVSLAAIGQYAGLIARDSAGSNSFYVGFIEQTSAATATAFIYRYTNGSSSLLAESKSITTGVSLGANDALEFDVQGASLKLFVNGSLATYAEVASATALASGSVGIYAYGAGVTIDSGFTANAIASGTAALTFTDNFTSGSGPSANQLNYSNWIAQYGNFSVATGNAVSQVTGLSVASVLLATPATDVSVQASVSLAAVGQFGGLIARDSAASNSFYVGFVEQTSATTATAFIYKYIKGSPALLAESKSITGFDTNSGGTLTFDVQGDSLKLFVNGSLAAYSQDTSATALTSGSVGIYANGAGVAFNGAAGFTASAIASGTTLPYGPDALNSSPFANQLNDADYLEQAGNYTVGASGATGNASVNLATLIDPNPTPASLSLDIAFSAANQTAGLVFGYSGPGDKNYFYASVTSTSTAGTVQVNLYQNVNGVMTKLATKQVTGFAGGLDVAISGDTITVSTDGVNQQLQVTDASFTNTGLIGFRSTAGATLSNFSAS